MKNCRLVKISNEIEIHETGEYVKARLEGYDTEMYNVEFKIEITDRSYYNYLEVRKTQNIVPLIAVDGRKIAVYHNGPIKTRLNSEIEFAIREQADNLICCYSRFLDKELLSKCLIDTIFATRSRVVEHAGKKYFNYGSRSEGLVPLSMFEEKDVLEGLELEDAIAKINQSRWN